jgi:hypothetical protein
MSTSGEKLRKYPDLTTWSFEAVDEQRYYNTQRYSGGDRHIASYIASLDLSEFDPKAPPPKTQASGRSSTHHARQKTPRWPTPSNGSVPRTR